MVSTVAFARPVVVPLALGLAIVPLACQAPSSPPGTPGAEAVRGPTLSMEDTENLENAPLASATAVEDQPASPGTAQPDDAASSSDEDGGVEPTTPPPNSTPETYPTPQQETPPPAGSGTTGGDIAGVTDPRACLEGDGLQSDGTYCHQEIVMAGRQEYEITMGGTVDMDHAMTALYSTIEVAFQPNLSLTLENVGDDPVINPRIVINDRGRWHTLEEMLEEFTEGAETDQERVMFLWEHLRRSRYHQMPLFTSMEPHDPVKLLNIYGFNLCGQIGNAAVSLFRAFGLEQSYNRSLGGHVQSEAFVEGAFEYIDSDRSCFYLDRENEYPVSGDACAYDSDIVRRELNYGPGVHTGEYRDSSTTAALFGPDDTVDSRPPESGHRIAFVLRPGERVTFRWDNIGKFAAGSGDLAVPPLYFGNSEFVYEPRLDMTHITADAVSFNGLAPGDDVDPDCPVMANGHGELVYEMAYSYLVAGGSAAATFSGNDPAHTFSIDVSIDGGTTWRTVWSGSGTGSVAASVTFDDALDLFSSPPEYAYLLRVRMDANGAETGPALCSLEIHTDVMAAPLSLPRLQLGANHVVYTDENGGDRQVVVTHRWEENHEASLLQPPLSPIYPPANARVEDSTLTYVWAEVEGAGYYHLRVSRRKDFAYPYRPALDVIIPQARWTVPFTGMYAPDTTYYWRVRARDENGFWGEWSDTWSFTWNGPRVPLNVRIEFDGREGTLRWEPNFRGPAPARYAVFASDELGFSVHRETYYQTQLGDVPPNFVAETKATSMVVISGDDSSPFPNKTFYRVSAIGSSGTESGPSDYAEAPHPWIYSHPPTEATSGQLYVYAVKSLASYGNLQYRNGEFDYYDVETITFTLLEGPSWLLLDPGTGELSGTPGDGDIGSSTITVSACNQFSDCDQQTYTLEVTAGET